MGFRGDDLTGREFNRWKVLGFSGWDSTKTALWNCVCKCGTKRIVNGRNLKGNKSRSCGCIKEERAINRLGEFYDGLPAIHRKEYQAWENMKQRCSNPNANFYHAYGGRGIKVCGRWADSFDDFLEDLGPVPSDDHSLGRLDNNGDYEPGNCEWQTDEEQYNNTQRSVLITWKGITKTATQWARELGVPVSRIKYRISIGWDVEAALTAPLQRIDRTITYDGRTQSVRSWAKELGIKEATLRGRLFDKMPIDRVLSNKDHRRSSTEATYKIEVEQGGL